MAVATSASWDCALRMYSCFFYRPHHRNGKRRQKGNDADHDQQFDQGKARTVAGQAAFGGLFVRIHLHMSRS